MTLPSLEERLLYRDGLMLVLDKPAGVPVHAGPGGGPNMEQGFDALRFGLPQPPGLAHRLDRDTSGCLILGRHRKALRKLGELFRNGRVGKTYWAVVEGAPPTPEGTVDQPLLKRTGRANWRMNLDPAGQTAVTDWRTMGSADGRTWLELSPRTGRTHQLRVHCQWLGCPIVGDPVYGTASATEPLMLHARGVIVPLYPSRDPIAVEAPPPAHMLPLLRACGFGE